jgi:hypothetical protein
MKINAFNKFKIDGSRVLGGYCSIPTGRTRVDSDCSTFAEIESWDDAGKYQGASWTKVKED